MGCTVVIIKTFTGTMKNTKPVKHPGMQVSSDFGALNIAVVWLFQVLGLQAVRIVRIRCMQVAMSTGVLRIVCRTYRLSSSEDRAGSELLKLERMLEHQISW